MPLKSSMVKRKKLAFQDKFNCPACGKVYEEPMSEHWIKCGKCWEKWYDWCTSYVGTAIVSVNTACLFACCYTTQCKQSPARLCRTRVRNDRWMNKKIRHAQLCLDNIVLFSVQYFSALVIRHHQALMKIHEKRTLTCNASLLNQLRSQLYHVFNYFFN